MSVARSEVLDVVDAEDRPVGKASVKDCLEKGLLHRAVAVVVVRSGGEMLLQRRSTKDVWHPGRWTLSSTGHVKSGETYPSAARRELNEELGIRTPVNLVGKFLLPRMRSHGLSEWEHVALFVSHSDQAVSVDPVEVETTVELSANEVRKMLSGRKLTPDAKVLLSRYFVLVRHDPGPRRPI
jgi:16S rRNA (adenine1518-N6/adenine1519-N6)-dimethyltransferase